MVLNFKKSYHVNASELRNLPEKNEEVKKQTTIVSLGSSCKWYLPKRYIFTLMNFFGFFVFSCHSSNLSIAIVAMVNLTAISTNTSRSEECEAPAEIEQAGSKEGDILWSSQEIGLVLGASALGSLITKFSGGRLAERFECKKLIGLSLMLSSSLTLLTPIAAQWGSYPTMVLRFLIGSSLGPILPGVIFMLGRWIPKTEKNFHISMILSGFPVASSIAPLIFASLCDSNFLGGWPSVLYVSGLIGLVWTLFWFLLIHETPSHHPTISDEELKYITENLSLKKTEKSLAIPWVKIVTSIPVWAFVIGYFSAYWSYSFFVTVHSLYLGTILHMPINKNGLHTCLPQLFKFLFQWVGAYITHWILKNKYFTSNVVAKVWTATSSVMNIVWFLGITLVGCKETLATTFFIFSFLANGVAEAEIITVCSNMAPALSGTIFGIGESIGTTTLFVIPAIVGGLIEIEQTRSQWNKVFYMNMAVTGGTSLFFVFFGTSEVQPWAMHPDDGEKESRPRVIEITKS